MSLLQLVHQRLHSDEPRSCSSQTKHLCATRHLLFCQAHRGLVSPSGQMLHYTLMSDCSALLRPLCQAGIMLFISVITTTQYYCFKTHMNCHYSYYSSATAISTHGLLIQSIVTITATAMTTARQDTSAVLHTTPLCLLGLLLLLTVLLLLLYLVCSVLLVLLPLVLLVLFHLMLLS